jgi:hypothetical protein
MVAEKGQELRVRKHGTKDAQRGVDRFRGHRHYRRSAWKNPTAGTKVPAYASHVDSNDK